MRILICGGRDYRDSDAIRHALEQLDPETDTIVHGGAPGADGIAHYWAMRMGFRVEMHPADWDRYGRKAGPIRNQAMIDSGVDLTLAFPTFGSRGTWDTVRRAKEAGIEVRVSDPLPPQSLDGVTDPDST